MAEMIFNPSNGISTDAPDTSLQEKKQVEEFKIRSLDRGKEQKILRDASQGMQQQRASNVVKQKKTFVPTVFARTFGVGQPRKALTAKDKLKIVRFRNNLQTQKLKNALQKFKIQRQIQLARQKGMLAPAQQVMAQPMPRLNYPAYSTPMEQQDIDASFNADIGNGEKSLFGNEKFHGEEFFDHNDFFLDSEFNQDPLMQLAIKYKTGVSPLWW